MTYSIILAGGEGRRLNSDGLPKQLVLIDGKPVICHTLSVFEACTDVDCVAVVSNRAFLEETREVICNFGCEKVADIVPGGASYWDSVECGMRHILELGDSKLSERAANKDIMPAKDDDIVTLHSAACPLVTPAIISENIAGAIKHGAAAASPPNTISTWPVDGEDAFATKFAKRDTYAQVQFPFSFKFSVLRDSLAKMHGPDFKPGDNPVFHTGYKFFLSRGAYENIKITTTEELDLAKRLLS